MNSQYSLSHPSVDKLVAKRLGLALLFILPIVALSSYFLQQHRLLTDIQEIVINRVKQFTLQQGYLLTDPQAVDNGTLQKRLNEFSKSAIIFTEGFVVSAIVVDNRGVISARSHRDNQLSLSSANKILKDIITKKSNYLSKMSMERIYIDNTLYFLLYVPVQSVNDKILGQTALLFLPSADRLRDIQDSIWKTTLAATSIVILTTLFIYPVIIRLTRQLSSLSFNLLNANLDTVKALGNAIAKRDSDTDAHNYRVTIYSVRLAEAIKLDQKTMQGLIKGAFLHDVGKIGTPDSILLKPGKLTEHEFDEMKNHVNHGVEIINSSSWLEDGKDVVLHHHEKYNGSGYSTNEHQVLSGKNIPIVARIFAIADVFDALTSRRPYKEPFDFDTTMIEMQKDVPSHFDPELFATFKTIARPLYDKLANQEDEIPRKELLKIVQEYFLDDLEQYL